MKKIIFLFLGLIWSLPVNIVTSLIILVLILFRQIRFSEIGEWSFSFIVPDDKLIARRNTRTLGMNLGLYSLYRESTLSNKVIRHENRHAQQIYVFGIFQPILYALFYIGIVFSLWWTKLDPYRDNPFEKDARRYADELN